MKYFQSTRKYQINEFVRTIDGMCQIAGRRKVKSMYYYCGFCI